MAWLEKHRKSGAWIVVSSINGKKVKKYLGKVSKKEADAEKALATAREKEAKIGRLAIEAAADAPKKLVTFGEWLPKFLKYRAGVYPASHETHENDLNTALPFFEDLPIADDPKTIDRWNAAFNKWEEARLESVSRTTVLSEWKNIKAALYRAARTGGLKKGKRWNLSNTSPISEIAPAISAKEARKKARKIFTLEELEDIYAADPKTAAIWKFLANTGLRREEARTMPRHLVETGNKRAKVKIAHDPDAGMEVKTGIARSVPLNSDAMAARDEVLGWGSPNGKFFPEWHKRTWSRKFEKARDAANVIREKENKPPITGTLHGLRHTFISRVVNNGVSVHLAMKWAGHVKMETTLGYLDTPEHYEWLELEKMIEREKGKVIELDKMRKAA